jgi:hypothetical protein
MATKTLLDTDSVQTATNKTFTGPVITAGVVALAAAPMATLDAATKGYVDALNINPLNNGSLAASVASNILTLTLKTAGGSTPSASDPVRITFRSTTDNDGSLLTRTVSASTAMTFASGSTLGMTNGVAARLWVGLLDNAGTVEVCAWNSYKTASSQKSLKGFTPNTDVTTTAEGSGTAVSAHVLYSTNARTTVPFVLLGFLEISEATAGVWATAPTVVQTYRDGYRKTGDVVQAAYTQDGEVATGTTTIPQDNTIPQNTEGDQFMSLNITPTNAVNLLRINHTGSYSSGAVSGHMTVALFQDSTANALAVQKSGRSGDSGGPSEVVLSFVMVAGSTASTTLNIRAGQSVAGTTTFNGQAGVRDFGGVLASILMIEEVYV